MNRLALTTLTLALIAPLALAESRQAELRPAGPHPLDQEAGQAAKALGGTLLDQVKSALKSGGPLNAIETCNTQAMPLTEQVSREQNMIVSRTALRIRNPENAPDAWERQVLEQFAARQQAGESLKGMRYSEVVEQDGREVYRMMQAIPTGKPCLTCHGSELAPEVAEKLDRLYPQDRARGFAEGDLRGAFSVKKVF